MCSDGLDSWFASLPLFGEVSEKNWERLDLDYDMEVGRRSYSPKNREDRRLMAYCVTTFLLKQKNTLTTPKPPASETCPNCVFMEASPRNLMMVPPVCTATLYSAAVIPVGYLRRRVPW